MITKKTKWSKKRAKAAFDFAVDALYEVVIGNRQSNIFALDLWLVATGIATPRNEVGKAKKDLPHYESRTYRLMKK